MTLLELIAEIKRITGNENVRWSVKDGEIIIYTGFSGSNVAAFDTLETMPFEYGG